jgi:hypothetical protein
MQLIPTSRKRCNVYILHHQGQLFQPPFLLVLTFCQAIDISKIMITDFSFGRIVANGQTCNNDIKIVQGTLVPDWWRKSGHSVEIEDLQDALDTDPEFIVIGQGQPGYMRITDSLREHLAEKNVKLIEEPTPLAIETFNRLFKEGRRVAGGFHVGC